MAQGFSSLNLFSAHLWGPLAWVSSVVCRVSSVCTSTTRNIENNVVPHYICHKNNYCFTSISNFGSLLRTISRFLRFTKNHLLQKHRMGNTQEKSLGKMLFLICLLNIANLM